MSSVAQQRLFRRVLLAFVVLAAVLMAVAGRTSEGASRIAPTSTSIGVTVLDQAAPAQQVVSH
jgi:hypothetical protein